MRAYSLAVAAAALDVDRKWLDNVLTQHDLDGVQRERQGVSRSIAPRAIVTIAVAIVVSRAFGGPLGRALALASELIENGDHAPVPDLSLRVDVPAIERRLAARLVESVEAHPPARRGRPPRETDANRAPPS